MSAAAKSAAPFVRQPTGYFVGFNDGFKVTRIVKRRRAVDAKGVRYQMQWIIGRLVME